jgi:hypothetical protein
VYIHKHFKISRLERGKGKLKFTCVYIKIHFHFMPNTYIYIYIYIYIYMVYEQILEHNYCNLIEVICIIITKVILIYSHSYYIPLIHSVLFSIYFTVYNNFNMIIMITTINFGN